jgi:hypothetical protein
VRLDHLLSKDIPDLDEDRIQEASLPTVRINCAKAPDVNPICSALMEFVRGHSSAGRAPALQAGGQRFDPAWLHQKKIY